MQQAVAFNVRWGRVIKTGECVAGLELLDYTGRVISKINLGVEDVAALIERLRPPAPQ